MPILEAKGSIVQHHAVGLVNPVNCVGVAGKGIALEFKQAYPKWFAAYKQQCENHEYFPGKCSVHTPTSTGCPSHIIDFATKNHWRNPSELKWVINGLEYLAVAIELYNLPSVAIPRLGCGNGGLDWKVVKPLIIDSLKDIQADIYLW